MSGYNFHGALRNEIEREKLARRILDVAEGDGFENIKKAFWSLAVKWHPDKNAGDRFAERQFRNIVNAYDYLTGKNERRAIIMDDRVAGDFGKGDGPGGAWRYFLWWRNNYFGGEAEEGVRPRRDGTRSNPFEEVEPRDYEKWYETAEGARIDAEEKSSLGRLLGPGEGRPVLDLGCGTGHFSRWLGGRGHRVVGVDLSRRFIRYAREHGDSRFIVADGADLPLADESVWSAVAIAVLEFARDPGLLVREMDRVVKRNLVFLLLNPDSELNRRRMKRGNGCFVSARFRRPRSVTLFIRDSLFSLDRRSLSLEEHEDFYIVFIRKGGAEVGRDGREIV